MASESEQKTETPVTEETKEETTPKETTTETPKEETTAIPDPPGDEADPFDVPPTHEMTAKEMVLNRKENRGTGYACGFACCCCFLCHEKAEWFLDYFCCRRCGATC